MVQQRKRKSESLQKSSTIRKSKLGSYLNRLKISLIARVRRKRIKPSDLKVDLNETDKQSISSSVKIKLSEKVNQTYQKTNKDIERGEGVVEHRPNKCVSPQEERIDITNTNRSPSNFTEIIEKEKISDLKSQLTKEDKIDEKVNKTDDKTISEEVAKNISKSNDSFIEEPIFKPLNQSVGQNGRISRLSFTNGQHFVMPSVSPDFGFNSKTISNHTNISFNSYTKYKNNRNLRINSLNKKVDRSEGLSYDALNGDKLEINPNV